MKKIIAFTVGTLALVGTAVGVQAFATTSHDEDKQPPVATQTTAPTTPPDGSTSGPTDGATKETDGQRSGFTEDHTGQPGETK